MIDPFPPFFCDPRDETELFDRVEGSMSERLSEHVKFHLECGVQIGREQAAQKSFVYVWENILSISATPTIKEARHICLDFVIAKYEAPDDLIPYHVLRLHKGRNFVFLSHASVEKIAQLIQSLRRRCAFTDFTANYAIGEHLTTDGGAKMMRVISKRNGKEYTLKQWSKSEVAKRSELRPMILNEIVVSRMLKHKHTLRILEVYETAEQVNLIYEMTYTVTLGESANLLRSLPISESMSIMIQLVEAVYWLHKNHLLHRKICPSNILLVTAEPPFIVKLANYTAAINSKFAPASELRRVCGAPGFIAPEMFEEGGRIYTEAADTFSLGSVFFYLLTGENAMTVKGTKQTHEDVLTVPGNQSLLLRDERIPSEAKLIVMGMLELNTTRRIKLSQVFEDGTLRTSPERGEHRRGSPPPRNSVIYIVTSSNKDEAEIAEILRKNQRSTSIVRAEKSVFASVDKCDSGTPDQVKEYEPTHFNLPAGDPEIPKGSTTADKTTTVLTNKKATNASWFVSEDNEQSVAPDESLHNDLRKYQSVTEVPFRTRFSLEEIYLKLLSQFRGPAHPSKK